MTDRETDQEGLVIRVPASLLHSNRTGEPAAPEAQRRACSFDKCGIVPCRVKRNSEHGITEAASLTLGETVRRKRVLALLDTPFLYSKISKLLTYLYSLALGGNGEQCYYAACAVSELASTQPFLDLKETILLPWASNEAAAVRNTAGIALGLIRKRDNLASEVRLLLRHWLSGENFLLADAALTASFWLAESHPEEALESMKTLIEAGYDVFYPELIDLFGEVSYTSLPCAIDHVHRWLLPIDNPELACMAALAFLDHVHLDAWAQHEQQRKKVVDIIFQIWENASLPLHDYLQEEMTARIENWAKETVRALNKEKAEAVEGYRQLFHDLFRKYQGQKRNRLQFHLERWQRNREREQAQIARRQKGKEPGDGSADSSFRDLAPAN